VEKKDECVATVCWIRLSVFGCLNISVLQDVVCASVKKSIIIFQAFMSANKKRKVVDLTADSPPVAKLDTVYILIHEKTPQDSGSDYQFSASLPDREDTDIIGVFASLDGAIEEANDTIMSYFEADGDDVDWTGEGFIHEGDEHRDDHFFIKQMTVQP